MRVLGNSQIIIVILLIALFILPANAKYGGGSGEPNDPYLIFTAEHLNNISADSTDWDKHFKLMADIDLSGFIYDAALIAPDSNNLEPGFQGTSFTGVFDGNGHIISSLTIAGNEYLGLFGSLSCATITDLGIVDVNIIGSGDYIGGLAGCNSEGLISKCFSTGEISGRNNVGGLIGKHQYGELNNCYSTATVSGQTNIGGLVGSSEYGLLINCYSTGKTTGENFVGGLIGWDESPYSTVIACFWDIETSGQINSAGGIGKTTAEMQTTDTFLDAGWDFVNETDNSNNDICWIDVSQNYPRLSWESIGDNSYIEETASAENEAAVAGLASESTSDVSERFTEKFTSGADAFDLAYKSITFTPSTDVGFYNATIQDITQLPTDPAGGTHLYLGDDSYMFINLSDPNNNKVYIYGFSYVRFFVGSNGYLTFTRGDTVSFNNLYNHFNTKRVCCLFQDLDPSRGGMVRWKQFTDRVAITWEDIREYGTSKTNTFQVEMFFDGNIRISWLEIETENCIVGLSRGLGIPDNFQEIDFSELPSTSTPPGETPPVSPTGRKNRKK